MYKMNHLKKVFIFVCSVCSELFDLFKAGKKFTTDLLLVFKSFYNFINKIKTSKLFMKVFVLNKIFLHCLNKKI